MEESVMKVSLLQIVPEFRDVEPPLQPPGAEQEHMVLKNCVKWPMKWPKTQIRLGSGLVGSRRSTGATSKRPPTIVRPPKKTAAITQKEEAVVATCNRHQQLLGASSVPQPDKGAAVTPQVHDPKGDDGDDDVDVMGFLNPGASVDMYMPPMDEEPFCAPGAQPSRPTTCTQRLDFQGLSQGTPPEAGDQAIRKPAHIFSPNTLRKTVFPVSAPRPPPPSPEKKEKKQKKRKRGPGASASQPAPKTIRANEFTVSPRADGLTRVHEAGQPILPPELLKLAHQHMKNLQQYVLVLEELSLKDKCPNYPVFTVIVPTDLDFIHDEPANPFFIAFEDVFNLFHFRRLDYNLVRLYALDMALQMKRDNSPDVVVADPYYMRDCQLLEGSETRTKAIEYLGRFMLTNKRKNYILLPVFPE